MIVTIRFFGVASQLALERLWTIETPRTLCVLMLLATLFLPPVRARVPETWSTRFFALLGLVFVLQGLLDDHLESFKRVLAMRAGVGVPIRVAG